MKNKGFTLIELLAVIVILAIIALIATPTILGVIDTAKRGSAESSTLGYVEAVEKSSLIAVIEKGSQYANATYKVSGDTLTEQTTTSCNSAACVYKIDYKGDTAEGTLTITDGEVSSATLKFAKIHEKEVDYAPATGAKIRS